MYCIAGDLMISAETMEVRLVKVQTWKSEMEKKSLTLNIGKTKILVSGINVDLVKKSGKDLCCFSGEGSNAISRDGCKP